MNKKYLAVGCLLTALMATVVVYYLLPTFESELEYYREYTTANLAWDNNEWIIRDVATDPKEHWDPETKTTILLSSFWDIKNFSETYSGMYGAECIFVKSTYKEVRETVELYKAVYIWYDSVERIIWTVAPDNIWTYPYWVEPEWRR